MKVTRPVPSPVYGNKSYYYYYYMSILPFRDFKILKSVQYASLDTKNYHFDKRLTHDVYHILLCSIYRGFSPKLIRSKPTEDKKSIFIKQTGQKCLKIFDVRLSEKYRYPTYHFNPVTASPFSPNGDIHSYEYDIQNFCRDNRNHFFDL